MPCYTDEMPATQQPRRAVELLGPSAGGIRAHVAELSRRLDARGWATVVAGPPGVMDGVGRQDADVDVPAGWDPRRIVAARRQLVRVLAGLGSHHTAVLHAHGLKAAAVALTCRRRPPLVLTIHNLVAGTHAGLRARLLRAVETAIVRRADHVVVISDEIAARLDGVVPGDRRTFVLPVAPTRTVSASREQVRELHGIRADAPLVVVVARLHAQKDLGTFLAAMATVVAAVPTVRALVVGDGPLRGELEGERARLGLDGVVSFTGHRPNPIDEMAAADVVALSSRWEGSPLVIAEYLSVGAPVVTTAVGTVARHLVDRESARIVPVGDAEAFAAAMLDLLRDPAEAGRIGAAGRRVGQTVFDAERLVDGVEQVYALVTGNRHR